MKPAFCYFSFILFLLFLFHFQAITASNNLIQETCKKCSQNDPNIGYTFCVRSLEAPPESRCADLGELGIIAIKLTRLNVTSTRHQIKKLLKNKKLDPKVKPGLNDCFDLYSDAIPTLKKAIKDYKSKHYQDANIGVSSVIDASTTCEDGFKDGGVTSPLTGRNRDIFQLSAISLSIINMFH